MPSPATLKEGKSQPIKVAESTPLSVREGGREGERLERKEVGTSVRREERDGEKEGLTEGGTQHPVAPSTKRKKQKRKKRRQRGLEEPRRWFFSNTFTSSSELGRRDVLLLPPF